MEVNGQERAPRASGRAQEALGEAPAGQERRDAAIESSLKQHPIFDRKITAEQLSNWVRRASALNIG
jgi:hypothetical protein